MSAEVPPATGASPAYLRAHGMPAHPDDLLVRAGSGAALAR